MVQNRIIISTRECNSLGAAYEPFQSTLDIYRKLLKVHSRVLNNKMLQDFLLNLTWEDSGNQINKNIFVDTTKINYDELFSGNRHFKKWLEANTSVFLEKLCETNDGNLIRKCTNEEIYVTPLISDVFSIANVEYIHEFAITLKDCGHLYLLLHDKDLYTEVTRCHHARCSDKFCFELDQYPLLQELINDGNVFVFSHEQDSIHKHIIQKLNSGISLHNILENLSSVA